MLSIPARLRRGQEKDEQASIEGAAWLIRHLCEDLGLDDLGDTTVLDFGCGVKFTQAILAHDLPVKRYVGVDVYREMIEFLQANVHDERFAFHHIDAHNDLYNPDGVSMAASMPLPIDGQTFDLICLFSVFTHLAPHDYVVLLELLRRVVAPTGRLYFTLFVDEVTPGGHGLVDRFLAALAAGDDEVVERLRRDHRPIATFRDWVPERPLLQAVYSRDYALGLVEGTGWRVVDLLPPEPLLQHHLILAPC